MLDSTGSVVVKIFIIVGSNVPTREVGLNPAQELGIDCHDVFELAVPRTLLDHPNLTVTLNDLGLDFAHFFIDQDLIIFLTLDNFLTCLNHALGTKRIGLPGPAQGGFGFLPRFQKRLVRPLGRETGIGSILVEKLKGLESRLSPKTENRIKGLPGGVFGYHKFVEFLSSIPFSPDDASIKHCSAYICGKSTLL